MNKTDDEDRIREDMKDLIDDNPIEEDESDGDSDTSIKGGTGTKRKKSDDEDDELDDRLEDEDYDLIEENLGVKVERVIILLFIKLQNQHLFNHHLIRNVSNVSSE